MNAAKPKPEPERQNEERGAITKGPLLESFMRETNGGGSLETVPGFTVRRAVADGFNHARLPVPPGYAGDVYALGADFGIQPALLGTVPAATRSILPPELMGPPLNAGLENVIGADDRVMVPDTATIPWRCICHLEVIFNNGAKGYGTGWLAGPHTVITAAHCVEDPRSKAKAVEIRVTPGRNGGLGPYSQFTTSAYETRKDWLKKKTPDLDVAAIGLPNEGVFADGVGTRLGYFGVAAFTDKELNMLLVNTSGYPVEARKPFATQWFNAGRVKDVRKDHITYMIDTEGGQSGGPIFFYHQQSEQRVVVAIHTTGYYPNRGVRITEEIFTDIKGWIDNPPGKPKAVAGKKPPPAKKAASPKKGGGK